MIDLQGEILAPPDRRTLADEVCDRLRQSIVTGLLQPGQQLREELLAGLLNVSRGPIREALSQLEREGLVTREPNRTARVARLTRRDVDEVYSLRMAIERLACSETMRLQHNADLQRFHRALAAMATGIEHGEAHEVAELDLRFHDLLYESSGHQRLRDCWANLRPQVQRLLLERTIANADFRSVLVDSHLDIIMALDGGNVEHAMAVIEEHIRSSYDRIVAGFPPGADAYATVSAPILTPPDESVE